jgi:hypothetical protein
MKKFTSTKVNNGVKILDQNLLKLFFTFSILENVKDLKYFIKIRLKIMTKHIL